MHETLTNLAGWIPAVVLPTAALLQLIQLVRTKSAQGVSLAAWVLFAFANVGLYIFTEKYFAPQSLIGLLGTAVINVVIVAVIISLRRKSAAAIDAGQTCPPPKSG